MPESQSASSDGIKGYALWLEAAEPAHTHLQMLIDDLATKYGTVHFDAHTTLLPLLDKTSDDLDAIKRVGRDVAEKAHGLTIECTGIGMRDQYFQSLFMPIIPSQMLVDLHQEARHELGHEKDPPFMPHWSLLYSDLSHSVKTEIATHIFETLQFPMTVSIGAVSIIEIEGKEWEVVERFPIGQ